MNGKTFRLSIVIKFDKKKKTCSIESFLIVLRSTLEAEGEGNLHHRLIEHRKVSQLFIIYSWMGVLSIDEHNYPLFRGVVGYEETFTRTTRFQPLSTFNPIITSTVRSVSAYAKR